MAKGFMTRRYGVEYEIPDGSTATPIDDYSTWLACAGIPDTFGSLANVIGSTSARDTLCNNLNALRYMVRSVSVIMPAVIANSGWVTALDGSTYSAKIPTMTSNTAPSGIARSKSQYDAGYAAWKGFDKNTTSSAQPPSADNTWWDEYEFTTTLNPYKATIKVGNTNGSTASVQTYKLQGSNDGTIYTDLTSNIVSENAAVNAQVTVNPSPATTYKIYRMQAVSGSYGVILYEMDIYGLNLN